MGDGVSAPAGWYEDPDDSSLVRWWDGSDWSDARAPLVRATPCGMGPTELWITRVLVRALPIGLVVAAALLVWSWGSRWWGWPIGPAWAVVLLFPLLFAGQLWVIVFFNARKAEARRSRGAASDWRFPPIDVAQAVRAVRAAVPAWVFVVLVAGFCITVLSFLVGVSAATPGGAQTMMPTATCPFPLGVHGSVTACVSESVYRQSEAAKASLFAAIVLLFLIIQTGGVAVIGGLQRTYSASAGTGE